MEAAAGAEFRCGRKIGAEVKTPEQGREQVPRACSFGSSGPGQSLGYKVLEAVLVFQNNGIVSPAIICGSQDHAIFLTSTPLSLSLGLQTLTTGGTVFRPSSVPRPFTSRHHSAGLLLSPWIARVFVCFSLTSLITLNFQPWSSEEARELPYSEVGPASVYACVPLAHIRCFGKPKNQHLALILKQFPEAWGSIGVCFNSLA